MEMTETEEDFEDIDLSDLDIDVSEIRLKLPQYPLIEFFKAQLETRTRMSTQSKKEIQLFIESLVEYVLEELAELVQLIFKHSLKKTIDIEVIADCLEFLRYKLSNKNLFSSLKTK